MKNIHTVKEKLTFNTFEVDEKNLKINSDPKVTFKISLEPSLKDHYRIEVKKNHLIHVYHGNKRSLGYAMSYLKGIDKMLQTGIYEDGPDFEMRGIIEGFYGTPWSHEDRLDVIDFLKTYRMNVYFYAPKDDPYHREKWRLPYPKEALDQLLALIERAFQSDIDFNFCISPGADFKYTENSEFEVLYQKIDQILSFGVSHFSLLLDDIDYELKGEAKAKFETPGKAHAYITNQLNRYIKSKNPHATFIMCPTEYWQNWDTPYRSTLKELMDDDVLVFWTGYNTIAEYIPNIDGKKVLSYFGHPLVLWDNYPVNDMTKDRIFMGPLVNRGKQLYQTHIGMVSNPMIQWQLSKPSLITMADFMWDSHAYNPETSYIKAIHEMTKTQPECFNDLKTFTDNNRHSLLSYDIIESLENAVETLDMAVLDNYFISTQQAFHALKKSFENKRFIEQAQPWFDRFDQDVQFFKLIKSGKATKEDARYIQSSAYTIGTNIITKLAKKLDLYDGEIYKKNRINYWDQQEAI
jgi:hyaluronoglucosaminidase